MLQTVAEMEDTFILLPPVALIIIYNILTVVSYVWIGAFQVHFGGQGSFLEIPS